jgi:pre-mRNA cleavage complex 2 protein Pcf11
VSVKFTSSSFKAPRPDLLKYLFDARPNRCNTCGRRFKSDDAGREKKARHLDWHFKTKTRLVDAERRGVQRSWYVDEREWIKSREYEDEEGPREENGDASTSSPSVMGTAKEKEEFIRVPNDAKTRSEPCPICQEKFESVWSEELQDFIWRDAIKVGNRVYHATCFHEATKDRENVSTPVVRTATPDSVLGKRKAEMEAEGGKKIKSEVVTEYSY